MSAVQDTFARAGVQINRFESIAWRYMRLSGILLIPLVFGHLAIMHVINSVYVIDYEWVIEARWAYLGWRIYDAAMLWLAGFHGALGLRHVIKDYVHNPRWSFALSAAVAAFMVFLLILGSIALIGAPFEPVTGVPPVE